ncbi:MAG: LCP family protein [Anaerolineales bacterium]|nr:LCP family protein [Anaerolineales bacterium]
MNRKNLITILCIVSLLLSSCSLFDAALESVEDSDRRVMAASLNTVTPTPFLPIADTGIETTAIAENSIVPEATALSMPQDPWESFPGPSDISAIEIPPPMPEVVLSDSAITFVLLGSDQRSNGYGYRTDTMIIVSVDPKNEKVIMLSVPRDLYVYIPGWKVERINSAEAHGGEITLEQTILYNFGITVDYWARVNFNGFVSGINSLGGIDVEVTGYLNDEYGGVWYNYSPGTYHMNGVQALGYVRMRKASSDFDRLRRQQEVVKAIFKKVISLDGLSRIPDLYAQFNDLFQTNVNIVDMLQLIPTASKVASGAISITGQTLTQDHVTSWTVPSTGAAVLLPKRDVLITLMEDLFTE